MQTIDSPLTELSLFQEKEIILLIHYAMPNSRDYLDKPILQIGSQWEFIYGIGLDVQ